ncbi:hypothetical protein Tco_0404469 [Tanacetum coccineum]
MQPLHLTHRSSEFTLILECCTFAVSLGCDPLALVDGLTPVEDNIGLQPNNVSLELIDVLLGQNLFQRDIKEMKDAFEQNDVYLDEIENQIDLHDEIERISKESNDVSFEVTQGLSKRIVELEKDLSKSEAKMQKENENFMASLQLENAHLKQTYKDLFESVQSSKVETHQCDEAKVKDDFDEIETRNIELEYRVASLIKENEHLKTAKFEAYFEKLEKTKVILERQLARKVDDSKAEKEQFLKEIIHLRSIGKFERKASEDTAETRRYLTAPYKNTMDQAPLPSFFCTSLSPEHTRSSTTSRACAFLHKDIPNSEY